MAYVNFGRSSDRATALQSTNKDKIFFPVDADTLILGGREFGRGSATPEYQISDLYVEAFLNNVCYDINNFSSKVEAFRNGSRDYGSVIPAMPMGTTAITDMSSSVYSFLAPSAADNYRLQPGHIYAMVDLSGNPTGTCRLVAARNIIIDPRYINVRDLGGLPTSHGGHIRYGRLFRGGVAKSGTNGHSFSYVMKLSQGSNPTALGDTVQTIALGDGFDSMLTSKTLVARALHAVIEQLVSNPTGDVFIHCQMGVHRTGMLCAILESLMGVGWSDILKDYELSCFNKKTSVNLKAEAWNYTAEDILSTCRSIKAQYGTLRQYAIQQLVVTEEEIDALCSAMVEGYDGNYTPEEGGAEESPYGYGRMAEAVGEL